MRNRERLEQGANRRRCFSIVEDLQRSSGCSRCSRHGVNVGSRRSNSVAGRSLAIAQNHVVRARQARAEPINNSNADTLTTAINSQRTQRPAPGQRTIIFAPSQPPAPWPNATTNPTPQSTCPCATKIGSEASVNTLTATSLSALARATSLLRPTTSAIKSNTPTPACKKPPQAPTTTKISARPGVNPPCDASLV